ncbi:MULTISPECIES: nitrate reductase [unclassified Variovorax]|uniref:nitrate reductase n=1 Tax=unclassified Variovorax TaxID=663243 RepID=UPI00257818CC|nr:MULTISPECIES: nitrate reductase [unclassified Variovorax]MDM0085817.1 molybdopterin-dependent oxidoreductase [Variovorax sp. J22G40]MDM0145925.1 molybdopterin-dependent oxidoreductase [Variovorax sp. J2P1-31]
MAETRSTCPYCGVGCGVVIESEGAQIIGVRGDPDHPANFGRLCTKGSTLHLTATAEVTLQARLLHPLRRAGRGAAPAKITWHDALTQAADTFAQVIHDHGPDAVGFYLSGQLLTEDYYVFNKLAKGLIGTNNIDTNSRLCMSSAVAGYKKTLGADAPPACYEDFDAAQCLFIVGSNTAWAHPIAFRRIEDAKRANPALKIVVVDPRRTDTCEIADLHLAIRPGTDVMLFHGLLHLMLREGWTQPGYIAAHTSGFEALAQTVHDCTPERVAQTCGIDPKDLHETARLFATSAATLSLYCQGLNQSSAGTAKNASLINLHLATAQIGRPGAGPFSLTGQPNAMGGREVGGMANLLGAHRDLANPAHRAEVAALWGVPDVPAMPGKTAVEMFEAAADGEIRALWIACTNPAQSMPDQATVRRALERCAFVVVQEAFATTATCAFADLLLPATTWGEKVGTVTNSERRISRVRPAVPAPGATRHDWSAAADFARRLEARLPARSARTLFPYALDSAAGAEAIWNEHRESTRSRDLDITGLSWALLDADGPQQWPLPEGRAAGRARLYEDGVFATPDGRARFFDAAYRPVAEAPDAAFPFSLNTGRLRDQWHGMSRTGTLGRLYGHAPEPAVQMHPQDMAHRHIGDGELVRVASRRGAIVLPAQASTDIGPGQSFIAMHWGEEALSGHDDQGRRLAGVNALSNPAFCPDSKQPELKHAAVRIDRAELPWSMLAMAWLPNDTALSTRRALMPLMAKFGFASCVPFGAGTARSGLLFRAAAAHAPDDALLDRIETLMGLQDPRTLRYLDRRRGQRRAARLLPRADGTAGLEAFLLGGDTRAGAWLGTLLREELVAQHYGRALLSPGASPPMALASRGKPVCNCLDVSDQAIRAELSRCEGHADARLAHLQATLKCGTQCGSCVPELRRMVRLHLPTAAPAQAAQ